MRRFHADANACKTLEETSDRLSSKAAITAEFEGLARLLFPVLSYRVFFMRITLFRPGRNTITDLLFIFMTFDLYPS